MGNLTFRRAIRRFERLHTTPEPTKRPARVFTDPSPDFITFCDNVLSKEGRVAFQTKVPNDSLLCCSMCKPEIKEKCRNYDWEANGWE